MVKKWMSKALSLLIEELLSSEEILEFQKLEKIILKNEEISTLLERLHNVEKQAVNAKELGLENAYYAYKKEYDDIDMQIANYPNVEEYMELLDEAYNDYEIIVKYIENKVNDKLN